MRTKLVLMLSAIAVLAAFTVSSATGATRPKPKSAKCTYDLSTQGSPSPTATSGKDLGYVKCGKPFGNGVQSDSFTARAHGTNVTIGGPVKDFFDNGTVHGTYTLSGPATGTTFKGSATITGGTGAYKHIKGSIKNLICTEASATQTHCTGTVSYTIG